MIAKEEVVISTSFILLQCLDSSDYLSTCDYQGGSRYFYKVYPLAVLGLK